MTLPFRLLILAVAIAAVGLRLALSRRPRSGVPWFSLLVWFALLTTGIVLWAWTTLGRRA